KEIQETLLKRCSINNASAVVFRKSYLISLFPLSYPFKLSGDYFIYIALAHTYKVAYLAKALNYYRAHNNNSFKPVGAVFLDEHFIIYNWMYNNSTSYLSRKEIAASFAETVAYPLVQTKKLFIRYFFVYLYKNYRFLWAFLKQIVYLYYKKFTQ
ncbi:MAG: hypothetical protein PF481_07465, partial [Bacteroidales bacterium]|nr:hypothetical protein [Bacteroidales bacterium]